jgi:signal transduction histidine kinase
MNDNRGDAAAVDPNALHYQEILFSLVMSVVAVLSRDNPQVVYPEILWAFVTMLVFNFFYHRLLKSRSGVVVPLVSMSVNVALISLVLGLSGGDQSSFWPLYLLPVFTACLHLERRHVLGVCAAAGAFLAYFYIEAFWSFARWQACEFSIKLGVIAFAAAVTARLSFNERSQRLILAASRERVEALAKSLERRTAADLLALRRESLNSLVPGIAHAINNPLAVILGSVELMLKDAPEGSLRRQDLERVHAAARRCAAVTEDLMSMDRREAAPR